MSATHQYPKFTVEFGGGDKNSKDIDSAQDILQMCILPLTPLRKHPPRAWGFGNFSQYKISSLFNSHDLSSHIPFVPFYLHYKAFFILSRAQFLAKY